MSGRAFALRLIKKAQPSDAGANCSYAGPVIDECMHYISEPQ
jgi:hypothetical protein